MKDFNRDLRSRGKKEDRVERFACLTGWGLSGSRWYDLEKGGKYERCVLSCDCEWGCDGKSAKD